MLASRSRLHRKSGSDSASCVAIAQYVPPSESRRGRSECDVADRVQRIQTEPHWARYRPSADNLRCHSLVRWTQSSMVPWTTTSNVHEHAIVNLGICSRNMDWRKVPEKFAGERRSPRETAHQGQTHRAIRLPPTPGRTSVTRRALGRTYQAILRKCSWECPSDRDFRWRREYFPNNLHYPLDPGPWQETFPKPRCCNLFGEVE